jgi:hypothetical protein
MKMKGADMWIGMPVLALLKKRLLHPPRRSDGPEPAGFVGPAGSHWRCRN